MVPRQRASSAMMLGAVPPEIWPMDTTVGCVGSMIRVGSPETAVTMLASVVMGSIATWG